jgi:hypothetical protein
MWFILLRAIESRNYTSSKNSLYQFSYSNSILLAGLKFCKWTNLSRSGSQIQMQKICLHKYFSQKIFFHIIRASPAVARLGPRRPFFTSGRRYSVQSRPRFLVFPRIWAFIHPASPGHPRSPRARSETPDERKAGMGPLCR